MINKKNEAHNQMWAVFSLVNKLVTIKKMESSAGIHTQLTNC